MRINYFILALILFFSLPIYADTSTPVYGEDKLGIVVSADKTEFVIKLKSNRTTGYSWYLRNYDGHLIQPIKHSFEAPKNTKLMGAPGYELWTFRVKPAGFVVPQQTAIRLIYARPWQSIEGMPTQIIFRVSTGE